MGCHHGKTKRKTHSDFTNPPRQIFRNFFNTALRRLKEISVEKFLKNFQKSNLC